MQDRFKFRGLSKGKWYYGVYCKHLPYTPYCCSGKPPEKDYQHLIIQEGFSDWGLPRSMTCIEVEKDTVGQCTGLKDIKQILIYEGDICKDKLGNLFEVYFDKRYCCFFLRNKNKEIMAFYPDIELEVLGNIYENMELLQ